MSNEFDSLAAAEAAGFDIRVPKKTWSGAFRPIEINGRKFSIRDTSGGNSFGYEYTAYDGAGRGAAKTHIIWIPDTTNNAGTSFLTRFRSDELIK